MRVNKWSLAFSVWMSTAVLLLPSMAAAESHLQTGAASAKMSATAHVDFKIIIPLALYLRMGDGSDHGRGAETVTIMSNSRNVALNATVRTSDDDGSDTSTRMSINSAIATRRSASTVNRPVSGDEARGNVILRNVILSAAARKVIAQDEQCMLGDAHAAAAAADPHGSVSVNTTRVVCTTSMP